MPPEIKTVISAVDETAAAWASVEARAKASLEKVNAALDVTRVAMEAAFLGVSVEKAGEFLIQTAEAADHLEKLAIKAGTSATSMAQLGYVAKLSDVDIDTLSQGIAKMQRSLVEAEGGSGKAAKALADMGLSVKELLKLTPEEQFKAIAEGLSILSEPAKQAAYAMDIFGRGGAALLPIMKDGAEGIEKLTHEYAGFSGALTDESIQRLSKLAEQWKTVSAAGSALASTLSSQLAPALSLYALNLQAVLTSDPAAKLRLQIASLELQLDLNSKEIEAKGNAAAAHELAVLQKQYLDAFGGQDVAAFDKASAHTQAARDEKYNADFYTTTGAKWSKDEKEQYESLQKLMRLQLEVDKKREAYLEHEDAQTETDKEKAKTAYDNFISDLIDLLTVGKIDSVEFQKRLEQRVYSQKGLEDVTTHGRKIAYKRLELTDEEIGGEQLAKSMQADMSKFFIDPTAKGLKTLALDFGQQMLNVIAELEAKKLAQSLFGADGGGGFWTSVLGYLGGSSGAAAGAGSTDAALIDSGAFLADGGEPSVGSVNIVGERGPELFIPKTAGTVVPNSKLGGATLHQTNIYNIDSRSDRQQIRADIERISSQVAAKGIQHLMSYNRYLKV